MTRRPMSILAALAVALVATATAAQTPPTDGKPIVIGQSYLMHSTVLNTDRRVNVYLPQDYGDPKRAFPVLYLLDGGEDGDFHHITGLIAVDGAYGAYQEMIVVGIDQPDRRHDLTSPRTT
jgi:predicted alpha/beta superfamily hydrolase